MKSRESLFENASLKLTSLYLVIIVFISTLFSIGLYRVSSDELSRSLNRPISIQERRVFGDVRETLDTIKQNRVDDLEEAQSRLRRNLVFVNIVILVSGGGVSYLLARRTLEPIEKAHLAQSRFTA